jgi:hypothetical protein
VLAHTMDEAQDCFLLLDRRGDRTLKITLEEHRPPNREVLVGIVEKMRCGRWCETVSCGLKFKLETARHADHFTAE